MNEDSYARLETWLNHVPDYYQVQEVQQRRKALNRALAFLRREIAQAEEQVTMENNAPRSNAARIEKIKATQELRNRETALACDLFDADVELASLEQRIKMFQNATYAFTLRNKLAL